MNLYGIVPCHAPRNEVTFVLAETDAEALKNGVFVAAYDIVQGYQSPHAEVFLVAADLRHVGNAYATDAPAEWEWAHPAVEEAAAREVCEQIEFDGGPR